MRGHPASAELLRVEFAGNPVPKDSVDLGSADVDEVPVGDRGGSRGECVSDIGEDSGVLIDVVGMEEADDVAGR